MKATVRGVFVFSATLGAHLKLAHRCARAIVRNVFDDREAGTAVRTVDERILVAAILGVKQFSQAVVTGRDISRDRNKIFVSSGVGGLVNAFQNDKVRIVRGLEIVVAFDGLNCRKRRRIGFKIRYELHDVAVIALNLNQDSGRVVTHTAPQIKTAGLRVNKRPEADALHDASYQYFGSSRHILVFEGAEASPPSLLHVFWVEL